MVVEFGQNFLELLSQLDSKFTALGQIRSEQSVCVVAQIKNYDL